MTVSRGGVRRALAGIICADLSIARVAQGLTKARSTADDVVLTEGHRVLIADPARFDGVAVIGVDEHVRRRTRWDGNHVTVIIDLTAVRDGTGPARLLEMVEGRTEPALRGLARRATTRMARRHRGRRNGWVHRLQERHHPTPPERSR